MLQLARLWLWCTSVATAGVSLWLFWVTATVLGPQDPEHIPISRVVACCFLTFASLSWVLLVRGWQVAWQSWLLRALSVGAIGAGLYGIVGMLVRGGNGGHFEGYVVLMGLVLCAHGSAALAYLGLAPRTAPPARTT
jgi:hypothetical protein